MEEITFMALSDTFTTLGNTIINLVNSRTAHKQNQLIAGDGIQITENAEEKNADICIHPDIEAAFQSVIYELEEEAGITPVLMLEDIVSGSIVPERVFNVSTNLETITNYASFASPYTQLLEGNSFVSEVNLSKLQSIGSQVFFETFKDCENLVSVDLSNLKTVGTYGLGSTFSGCTNLVSVNLSSLQTLSNVNGLTSTFSGCTKLTSVEFNSLQMSGNSGVCMGAAFENCTNLKTISFPGMRSFASPTERFFGNMLQGVTGCTVHFPSNLESVIGSWEEVENGFGGTDTVTLFDLPST